MHPSSGIAVSYQRVSGGGCGVFWPGSVAAERRHYSGARRPAGRASGLQGRARGNARGLANTGSKGAGTKSLHTLGRLFGYSADGRRRLVASGVQPAAG